MRYSFGLGESSLDHRRREEFPAIFTIPMLRKLSPATNRIPNISKIIAVKIIIIDANAKISPPLSNIVFPQ